MKINLTYYKYLQLLIGIFLIIFLFPEKAIPSPQVEIRTTVACDEEWVDLYGDHWKQAALNAIEEADRELVAQFGINLSVSNTSFTTWKSNNWELNLADLLDQVAKTIKIKPKDDILIAFSGQKTDYVGMAYVEGKYCIVMHQNPYYDGIVTRHEVSHLFGCEDEDPPSKNIMSEWWDYPSLWGKECRTKIAESSKKFSKKGRLSKGTPSVPQGPAITLQENHDLQEANKFNRFTEHMIVKEDNGIDVSVEALNIGRTKDFLTDIEVTLEIFNNTGEKLYVYDLIFTELFVSTVQPKKRYLVDKKTDHFSLNPKESKQLAVNLGLPWFQKPHPDKLKTASKLSIDIVSSSKRIDVDEFFIVAKKKNNFMDLPQHLRVLNFKKDSLKIE